MPLVTCFDVWSWTLANKVLCKYRMCRQGKYQPIAFSLIVTSWNIFLEKHTYFPSPRSIRSPWYNRHGWLGVSNQLSIYLSNWRPMQSTLFRWPIYCWRVHLVHLLELYMYVSIFILCTSVHIHCRVYVYRSCSRTFNYCTTIKHAIRLRYVWYRHSVHRR